MASTLEEVRDVLSDDTTVNVSSSPPQHIAPRPPPRFDAGWGHPGPPLPREQLRSVVPDAAHARQAIAANASWRRSTPLSNAPSSLPISHHRDKLRHTPPPLHDSDVTAAYGPDGWWSREAGVLVHNIPTPLRPVPAGARLAHPLQTSPSMRKTPTGADCGWDLGQ